MTNTMPRHAPTVSLTGNCLKVDHVQLGQLEEARAEAAEVLEWTPLLQSPGRRRR